MKSPTGENALTFHQCGGGDPTVGTTIFVQCTYPPSFIILCLIVRKLSCRQTHKETNIQTDAAENTHLTPLCYPVENKFASCRTASILLNTSEMEVSTILRAHVAKEAYLTFYFTMLQCIQ